MSLKKTVAIAAAAGALAAVSVPAMAFENEFHGSYTFSSVLSNFQDGGSGNFTPTTLTTLDRVKANNYYEQRTRLQYIAKASDDLKLITHFEINNRFGNINVAPASKGALDVGGNDIDTDGTNLVTKHAYLDFNLGTGFNAKLGLMPYKDTINGLLVDADVPAVALTAKAGSFSSTLGFTRLADGFSVSNSAVTSTRLGERKTDLYFLDNKFAVSKDMSVALSYYLLSDNDLGTSATAAQTLAAAQAGGGFSSPQIFVPAARNQQLLLHTFGLSGTSKTGPLTLSGFAALQTGKIGGSSGNAANVYQAQAAGVSVKAVAGPGAVKAGFLYASGDKTGGKVTSWTSTGTNSYNGTGMMILARDTANSPTSTDRYLRRVVTDLALANVGFDADLSDKVYVNTNAGFGWRPGAKNADARSFMGTELNIEPGYKVNSNLTLRAQAAYMILGKEYNRTARSTGAMAVADPENPYTVRLLASFKF